jgi:hypothetical protein
MPPLVHAALAVAIVLSGVGAVTICLLIVAYGFTHAPDEPPDRATRRLLTTRIGHAVAAACFAGTAVLLAVVLAQAVRAPASAPAGDPRLQQLGLRVEDQGQRIEHVERRVEDAERALERVATDASERVAVPAETPAAVSPPVQPARVVKKVATPATHLQRPRPPETTAPPVPATGTEPVTSTALVTSAPPVKASTTTKAPTDLRAKLRADWRAIRHGLDTASDDFRRAIAPLTGRE